MAAPDLSLVDDDYITRMTGFESDCNEGKGDPMACHQVGEFFSLVKGDRTRAAKVYDTNCAKNSYSASCFNLAKLYMSGMGVAQSDQKAEDYFKQSCATGHLYGCYHQGLLMFLDYEAVGTKKGPIVPKKLTKRQAEGLRIIEGACVKGENDSCYLAGSHYVGGATLKRDPIKATSYLERACTGNHAPSCYNLAVMYARGDVGVDKNEELFKKYQRRTSDLIAIYGSVDSKKLA